MLVSLLASVARTVSSLWVGWIDLRCIIFALERGGITLEGLKTMSDGLIPIPGVRQFRWKTNFVILIIVHAVLFGSSFLSPVLTGSITWQPGHMYFTWDHKLPQIPHTNKTGRRVYPPNSLHGKDWVMRGFMSNYLHLWGEVDLASASPMRRSIHRFPTSFPPIGSIVEDVTIPYFAVDAFEWIRDPSFALTSQQILALTSLPLHAPPEMAGARWGLIPDVQWGRYNGILPAPHSVTESRIFATSYRYTGPCMRIGFDVYSPNCFTFANVTYRAGAARCAHCRVHSLGGVKDYGDFKDLKLINDSITTVALAMVPYLGVTIKTVAPSNQAFGSLSILKNESIELLSRSYQLAWDAISLSGEEPFEWTTVHVAVDAMVASVTIWSVAVWCGLHTLLLVLGILFRCLSMCGDQQWIENLSLTALLVDPTSLQDDMGKSILVVHKLERDARNQDYIIITQSGRSRADLEQGIDSATRNLQDSNHEPDVLLLDLGPQRPITPSAATTDGHGVPVGEFGSARDIGLGIWGAYTSQDGVDSVENIQGDVASDGSMRLCTAGM